MQWLGDLYQTNRRQLFLIAWGILREQDLAEDAVHAAFLRLAQLPQPPREPKPYAFRAVRNVALNLLSSRARRREQPLGSAAYPVAPIIDGPDRQLLEALRQAVEQLEQESREVVELHLQAALTFQEIADLRGEPLSTVASRYRRALAKLRRSLDAQGERMIAQIPVPQPSGALDSRIDTLWIHFKTVGGSTETSDLWFSFPRAIAASRRGIPNQERISFTDLRAGVKWEFDPTSKTIFRLPTREAEQEEFQSLATMFHALFRGEPPPGDRFAEDRIVARTERAFGENGQKWIEHELRLERAHLTATVVIRVQADTHLPVSMTLSAAEGSLRWEFEYPNDGPADIHALGVPRDTAVDDRVPTGQLAEIIRCLDASRRDLDHYFAVVSDDGGLVDRFVWRKGNKWRVDFCGRPPDPGEIPTVESEQAAWWRQHLAECEPVPIIVCDGDRVYHYERQGEDDSSAERTWVEQRTVMISPGRAHSAARSFGDAGRFMIELEAFPKIVAAPQVTMTVDPAGTGGPAGSVLVETKFAISGAPAECDDAYQRQRFWLDPQRRYAALACEVYNSAAVERDPDRVLKATGYDEFRQSPQGIWYPTLVRRKRIKRAGDQDVVTRHGDKETRFFLDFSVDLPDELFRPTTDASRP
jgi:RNA polymerase sigma-70 factor (ECF subfamily)